MYFYGNVSAGEINDPVIRMELSQFPDQRHKEGLLPKGGGFSRDTSDERFGVVFEMSIEQCSDCTLRSINGGCGRYRGSVYIEHRNVAMRDTANAFIDIMA